MSTNDLSNGTPPSANGSANKSDPQQAITRAKPGAPSGNGNSIRHGLTAGKLPKGAAYVARSTAQFRAALEQAVMDRTGGDVPLVDAASIQTAIRWERHALLAQRWLRNEAADLTPDQRLAFSRDVARASAERDKCIRALCLETTGSDWPTLEGTATPTPADELNPTRSKPNE